MHRHKPRTLIYIQSMQTTIKMTGFVDDSCYLSFLVFVAISIFTAVMFSFLYIGVATINHDKKGNHILETEKKLNNYLVMVFFGVMMTTFIPLFFVLIFAPVFVSVFVLLMFLVFFAIFIPVFSMLLFLIFGFIFCLPTNSRYPLICLLHICTWKIA